MMEGVVQSEPQRRKLFQRLALFAALLGMAVAAFLALYPTSLGGIFSKNIIEQLDAPVRVRAWDRGALILEDGKQVRLPELKDLPAENNAILGEATKHGIELAQDGRVYGLVKIHHWCGNDSVDNHLAKVDLSRLLLFAGYANPAKPMSSDAKQCSLTQASISKYGWRIEEYLQYRSWNDLNEHGAMKLFQE